MKPSLLKLPNLVFLLSFLAIVNIQAQDNTETADADSTSFSLTDEFEQPTLELSPNAVDRKKRKEAKKAGLKKQKEVKRKKNEFYGIRARKMILKKVRGKNVYTEKFYILPKFESPNKYVQDKYYFNPSAKPTKRKIIKTKYVNEKYGYPLHGLYEKRLNGEILTRGYYYKGTKHGRWVTYLPNLRDDRGMELKSKEKFDKGFPKDSRITYYDTRKTRIKEVIPFVNGKKEGTYYMFYKSGRVMESGNYQNEKKIGRWTEFYDKDKANFLPLTLSLIFQDRKKKLNFFLRKRDMITNILKYELIHISHQNVFFLAVNPKSPF